MNLIVDIGNTKTKLHVFDQGAEVFSASADAGTPWMPLVPWKQFPLARAVVCSVREDPAVWVTQLSERIPRVVAFPAGMPLPVRVAYRSPQTLGADRLAAVCGAWKLAPGQACLVVDLGTAVTYDYLTADWCYAGGNIAPGLRMRLAALHEHTARLPQVEPQAEFPLLGDTTETAVRSGVMQGVLYEMEGYVRDLSGKNDDFCLFLTGGDANYFEKRLKSRIFVCQNLVAVGLNAVLEWNETR
ncbi:MAG: type III pantothenate kinase [Paludibacteraceae bacterium]|nr:type III pantothenate kinase [Paludibacteraceae bacterium]